MKRETVYQLVRDNLTKQAKIIEVKGYLYDVVTLDGTVRVGLVYKRPYWTATHYESGLDCTPFRNPGGYKKDWKSQEELLEALKDIPFKKHIARAQSWVDFGIDLVEKHKKENNNERMGS